MWLQSRVQMLPRSASVADDIRIIGACALPNPALPFPVPLRKFCPFITHAVNQGNSRENPNAPVPKSLYKLVAVVYERRRG